MGAPSAKYSGPTCAINVMAIRNGSDSQLRWLGAQLAIPVVLCGSGTRCLSLSPTECLGNQPQHHQGCTGTTVRPCDTSLVQLEADGVRPQGRPRDFQKTVSIIS